MDDSEEHFFDQAEIEAERLEERNGEDIEGELFRPRSEDGSDSEGSLNDFMTDDDESPADRSMYAALAQQNSPPVVLPAHLQRRRRRVIVSFHLQLQETCNCLLVTQSAC